MDVEEITGDEEITEDIKNKVLDIIAPNLQAQVEREGQQCIEALVAVLQEITDKIDIVSMMSIGKKLLDDSIGHDASLKIDPPLNPEVVYKNTKLIDEKHDEELRLDIDILNASLSGLLNKMDVENNTDIKVFWSGWPEMSQRVGALICLAIQNSDLKDERNINARIIETTAYSENFLTACKEFTEEGYYIASALQRVYQIPNSNFKKIYKATNLALDDELGFSEELIHETMQKFTEDYIKNTLKTIEEQLSRLPAKEKEKKKEQLIGDVQMAGEKLQMLAAHHSRFAKNRSRESMVSQVESRVSRGVSERESRGVSERESRGVSEVESRVSEGAELAALQSGGGLLRALALIAMRRPRSGEKEQTPERALQVQSTKALKSIRSMKEQFSDIHMDRQIGDLIMAGRGIGRQDSNNPETKLFLIINLIRKNIWDYISCKFAQHNSPPDKNIYSLVVLPLNLDELQGGFLYKTFMQIELPSMKCKKIAVIFFYYNKDSNKLEFYDMNNALVHIINKEMAREEDKRVITSLRKLKFIDFDDKYKLEIQKNLYCIHTHSDPVTLETNELFSDYIENIDKNKRNMERAEWLLLDETPMAPPQIPVGTLRQAIQKVLRNRETPVKSVRSRKMGGKFTRKNKIKKRRKTKRKNRKTKMRKQTKKIWKKR